MTDQVREDLSRIDFSILAMSDAVWLAIGGEEPSGRLIGGERPNPRRPELPQLRIRIDTIQHPYYFYALARLIVTAFVGLVKQKSGEDPYVPARHQAVIYEWVEWCRKDGVPEEIIDDYFRPVIEATMEGAIKVQRRTAVDPGFRRRLQNWLDRLYDGISVERTRNSRRLREDQESRPGSTNGE